MYTDDRLKGQSAIAGRQRNLGGQKGTHLTNRSYANSTMGAKHKDSVFSSIQQS